MKVKVNINDMISKLINYAVNGSNRDTAYSLVFTTMKQIIEFPDEVTFQKQFVKNN